MNDIRDEPPCQYRCDFWPPGYAEEINHSITGVCDSCLDVAYDMGVIESSKQQAAIMQELGGELADHKCDAKEEPEYFREGCACGCNPPA